VSSRTSCSSAAMTAASALRKGTVVRREPGVYACAWCARIMHMVVKAVWHE
jgi:hypothetical protein